MMIDNKLILENSKNLNILYVEDDTEIRESTIKLFLNYFKSVDFSENGQTGLSKYETFFNETGSYYDIVISDIKMPICDGLEMCTKIKSINNEQALIFITAFNDEKYLNAAIKLGVNGFIRKPIELDQLTDVFYTVCQSVTDKNILGEHYKQIEDRNMLNINQRDASSFNFAVDILVDLEENKEKISRLWTDKQIVHERLSNHTIDVEYFRSHYGIKVIEYFLSVIRGDNEAGNCPVIFVMLDFFKQKNLPLEDIFMVCVLFKNTMTTYILERYTFNRKLFEDISFILDKNFEGVIINYLDLKYTPKMDKESLQVQEVIVEPTVIEAPQKLEIEEDLNYAEYVLETDVYELQDLEEDIDNLAISVAMSHSVTIENCTDLGLRIQRYGEILTIYPIFSALGKSISKLGNNFIVNAQMLVDDPEKMSNITALIEGFVNDLIVWRKEIFENNIEDPYFLDNSFFSNVDTIIMFIEYEESAMVEDDLDDMFF